EASGLLPHYHVLTALSSDLHRNALYIAAILFFFSLTVLVTVMLIVPIMRDLRERQRQITLLYESIQTLSSSLDL
ncbi:MAG: hypothetical protein C4309_14205, partial [Chloroflexota bacterium]